MLRRHPFAAALFWTLVATLVLVSSAGAYVGPGAGLEFVGYALSLLAMVGFAFFSILLWPFYRALRWMRGGKPPAPEAETHPTAPSASPPPAAEQASDSRPSPPA